MTKISKIITLLVLIAIFAIGVVNAQPLGVDEVAVETSERYNDTTTPIAVDAQAGNVTQLSINATGVTTSWQGYYGNVTGSLILADAAGNNFYDWNISSPSGEVYAARTTSVDWSTINCSEAAEITSEETYLGQDAADPDSVSNTYSVTSHPDFLVGSTNITGCSSTHAYDSTGDQGTGFWQVLLADGGANSVYTSIIDETVQNGFNNLPWHFQLLVGENGKPGNEAATPYYFYVELQ